MKIYIVLNLFLILFEWHCIVLLFKDSVLYARLCNVWHIQSHIYGWLDWNWNKFISYFEQLYHSNVGVFYYVRWIGLCIKIVVLLLCMDG